MHTTHDDDATAGVDRYDAAAIREALATRWIGRQLWFYSEVSSTNHVLRAAAEGDAPAGAVAVADFQIEGRGRQGRRWEAPPGTSMLASVLLRPEWPAERAPWLVMAAALAAARAIDETCGLAVGLKWPNDLLAGDAGAERKLGGILVESVAAGGRLTWAIVGCGINANVSRDQLPIEAAGATSLLIALGGPVARVPLLAAYLAALENECERMAAGESPLQHWRERLITLGREVAVADAGGRAQFTGTAEDVDDWGRLIVRAADGRRHVLAAGDVSLRH